jgi:hypothetical protein
MENPIPVIALSEPDFEEQVARCLQRRRNIIILGTSESEMRRKLSPLVSLDGYSPDLLNRWGIYALAEVLTPDDLNTLLQAERQKKCICIVEQIKLPLTKPPQVKPVLVYSEPQGVIGDFDTVTNARTFLENHRAPWNYLRKFPRAGIYQWEHDEWQRVTAFV